MKKKLLLLILPIITIILEALPYGVVMQFMAPTPKNSFVEYYSYFDTFPMGYAMFNPFLTAILSCVILLLMIVYYFYAKSELLTAIKILLYVTIAMSVCHLIMGFKYLSLVGGLVTLSMITELIVLYVIGE